MLMHYSGEPYRHMAANRFTDMAKDAADIPSAQACLPVATILIF
jgi:hypothetical protein